jgi:hypothetical protein
MIPLRAHAADRIRRHLMKLWQTRGGGFYGFVTLLTFLYLEGADLAGDLGALPHTFEPNAGWALSWVIGNFVDAIVNGVMSAIWPVHWIGQFGVGLISGGLLGVSYVTYRLIHPTVLRLLSAPDDITPALERPIF